MKVTHEQIENFISEKKRQEVAENTIKAYSRDLETFEIFFSGRDIDQAAMIEYRQFLEERYKPQSVNRKIRTANQFLAWIGAGAAKVKNVKLVRNATLENVMTPADLRRMLKWADKLGMKRERAIMETLVATGIRIGELEYITVEAVKEGRAVVDNKGSKREVPLPAQAIKILKEYCKATNIVAGVIFRTKNGTPISNPQLSRSLKKIAGAARVNKKKIHPHAFRHLFAVNYLESGENVLDLQSILGHKSLDTTSIYTRTTAKNLARKMANSCILDKI